MYLRLSVMLSTFAAVGVFFMPFANAADTKPGSAAVRPEMALQLGAPFADNAILQREMPVPVWGWSQPGETITVTFAGQKQSAKADASGKWVTELDALKASFEPRDMIIADAAGNKVILQNILVGEVWLASGQSNMEWPVAKTSSQVLADRLEAECAKKGIKINPIREFAVTSVTSQLHPIEKATGHWKEGQYRSYSAIAFAFAHSLYNELHVPVGILNCSFSQTQIEAWVPREGWATGDSGWAELNNRLCRETDPRTPEHKAAWEAFYTSLENQIAANEAAIKSGQKAKEIGAAVPGSLRGNRDASWLYNGKLHPVVPYAIRGGIWNQGFANKGDGLNYYNNLHCLIRGWRVVWDRPELPVYFHQFYAKGKQVAPSIGGTEEMRLGTWMARDIPHAGMASQIDIDGAIHYHNKAVPGQRLALHALKKQYDKDVVAEGPMFKAYEVKGDKVIVKFDFSEGGLVVASTAFNRSDKEGASGMAEPVVIEDGEDKVNLFWLAGEDRVWHPATFVIKGDEVVVTSKGVSKPRGVSYAASGVGFAPGLYNKALLPMTPFIQYDNKMVTSQWWPDPRLKIVGETIDPDSVGATFDYRKMPLLSVQFRDNAVFQADQPVAIWGSTRKYGEWQDGDEKGDCAVHFEFAPHQGLAKDAIKKVIPVEAGMAEWMVELPPMKADGKAYRLKAAFSVNGEVVHERVATNIVFGDVWYVAAPDAFCSHAKQRRGDKRFEFEDSGQIVRYIANGSKRDRHGSPSRFSLAVSRLPENRFAAKWRSASGRWAKTGNGIVAKLGHTLAAKSKRPVGIIFMVSQSPSVLKHWIAPEFLKDSPSTMDDYKTVGSQYPGNPYYLENVRRYMNDWKEFWGDYIPAMIRTGVVPEDSRWGRNWGGYPTAAPDVGDSEATQIYNLYVRPYTPLSLRGIVFLMDEEMVPADHAANFGPEMAAIAKTFKDSLGNSDTPFVYVLPDETLLHGVTKPEIKGRSTAVTVSDWEDVDAVIDLIME